LNPCCGAPNTCPRTTDIVIIGRHGVDRMAASVPPKLF
jgi:hypothetical protein